MSVGGVGLGPGPLPPASRRGEAVVGAVSGLLGLTPRGLRHELESGRTMTDLAAERGIGAQELLRTVNEATLLASHSRRAVDDAQTRRAAPVLAARLGGVDTRI